jgi:uncharacterized coiled-coil DUF342 family protein
MNRLIYIDEGCRVFEKMYYGFMASDLTKKDIMDVLLEFHEKVTEPVMEDVLGRIGNLEKGVSGLKKEVGCLGKEVDNLGKEVGGLKKEVGSLKSEVGSLRNGLDEVRNDIARVERKLDAVTDHQAEVLDRHEREIGRLKLAMN